MTNFFSLSISFFSFFFFFSYTYTLRSIAWRIDKARKQQKGKVESFRTDSRNICLDNSSFELLIRIIPSRLNFLHSTRRVSCVLLFYRSWTGTLRFSTCPWTRIHTYTYMLRLWYTNSSVFYHRFWPIPISILFVILAARKTFPRSVFPRRTVGLQASEQAWRIFRAFINTVWRSWMQNLILLAKCCQSVKDDQHWKLPTTKVQYF